MVLPWSFVSFQSSSLWVLWLLQRCRSPTMAHSTSTPELRCCGLPPSLRSQHQVQLTTAPWYSQGSQARRETVKLQCYKRECFRRHTDCPDLPHRWRYCGSSSVTSYTLLLDLHQEEKKIRSREELGKMINHFKPRSPIKYFPSPLLLITKKNKKGTVSLFEPVPDCSFLGWDRREERLSHNFWALSSSTMLHHQGF